MHKRFYYTTLLITVFFTAASLHAGEKDLRMDNIEAAKKGDVEAQFQVGEGFCCGNAKDHDIQKATWWYCDAARDNHKQSQFRVGQIYRTDRNLEISEKVLAEYPQLNDDVLAYVWMKIADKNGHPEAKAAWQEIKGRLKPAQLQEAESMIPFFPYLPCEIELGAGETENAAGENGAEEAISDSDTAPAAGGN